MAAVNSAGFGIGLFVPGTALMASGLYGSPSGGYLADSTVILQALQREKLDFNIVYDVQYDLILGDIQTIQGWVYQHKPDLRPNYVFSKDRQHWIEAAATDTGFPDIQAYGRWRVW